MSEEKAVTVQELKNWLEGVLDFQEEGWAPNTDQWEKIKKKIFNLEESPKYAWDGDVQMPPERVEPKPKAQEKPKGANPSKVIGNELSDIPITKVQENPDIDRPLNPKKLPPVSNKTQRLSVDQNQSPTIEEMGEGRVVHSGKRITTGNIDTSDGEYHSDFA